jgi:NAD+ kinase
LIANLSQEKPHPLVDQIENYLKNRGIKVKRHFYSGNSNCPPTSDVDLVFSLGGDGTVLYSSRCLSDYNVPIIAVNLGDFGFITEVAKDEWQSALEKYLNGDLGISPRLMLDIKVYRNEKLIITDKALNDAVICSGELPKLVRLEVNLAKTRLGSYRADGIIVATPTGSTGYSASAGGPILDPEMEAFIINPICPFTLSNRPIVARGNEEMQVEICEGQRTEVVLTVDGQNVIPLKPNDQVLIKRAEKKALIVLSDKRNFFEVLRTKLNWSGGPDA